ncbi:transporter substrate-binding domain-containing protein [Bifidobacterium callimiconis]|uniref:transporter substrate-binding domain-containing protein n=1 Tax=Bifidobacterium callimiconis TaxID=2306973 RepID=UPI001BDD931C|nr:transporter substrate-binding domain-containing protein [Bifidobacterium callimiconis]MBT1176210.1 transporter substrate-binding domain-containing protein [Bifidobacterium callimiconis]
MTMRRTAIRAAAALLVGVMTMPLAACGRNPLDVSEVTGPRIVIGVTFDQPGMGLRKGNQYSGFNVKVAEYVAHKLGYAKWQIVWEEAPYDQRVTMLADGDVDMVTGMYIDKDTADSTTAKAELGYDFAGPYLAGRQDVMMLAQDADDVHTIGDLAGRRVCVVAGSRTVDDLNHVLGSSVTMLEQPSATQCTTALMTGMVDAVSAEAAVLAGMAASADTAKVEPLGLDYAQGEYGIGLKTGSDKLVSRVKAALADMKRDGSLTRAYAETLGEVGYKP